MKTSQFRCLSPFLALAIPLTLGTGCTHIPKGGASAVKVSFGIPSVFNIEKTANGIVVTDARIKVADSASSVQIFLFKWESLAKDLVLTNPKP